MKKKIYIDGMSCSHCVSHVKEALLDIGATKVKVDLEEKFAMAEFEDETTDNDISEAIEEAGYEVTEVEEY
ncbi:heavy-metal-associated domain-containing protein [Clostridium estertheticum]|mgnify:CR=1 FL=1|uniref:Heavy metal transport/detoxification protein n=3 Tax=Clostridium estertheticum TaxID=238834 RepID=A0A1J0GCD0_9CLOT|nr:heavy-metal-associated domain-containing protein [Clostridium estertheticum]APC39001.1 heavy metal transport/detoxification protein [Clostridium estertheticum subsp. estertheticum]MBU3074902.1 heavy-metal-associated domain-containing protein [Clostridium estertheticum]MBU3155884.1 heavy-metal-associated domain-containing protein [Clostridium estertheticum]MBU3165117.1 heavy-metal-associated domain-containing protein [Clostridium estertheticum]MBU3174323.1 heavy-metal-associated domain-conta